MTIQRYLNAPLQVDGPAQGLTIVQLAAGQTVPPHTHSEGYVVVPFSPSSAERVTHENDRVVGVEQLTMLPLVPYYVEPTKPGQAISLRNTGGGPSTFQKIVPEPPITGPQPQLPTEPLSIVTQGNARYDFTVEVAVTLMQQAVGLMFRPSVAANGGMLFAWLFPREVAMYMRNVLVPLDILFIDDKLKITHIHENASPGDSTPIPSQGKVLFTLELAGGTVGRLGIAKGDTIQ